MKELTPDTKFYVNDYGIILNKYDRFALFQQLLRDLISAGAPVDAIGLQSHIGGDDALDWNMIKERVETLSEEFNLPIWITEFDWNGDESAEFGDHSRHAEIVEDFYRLMFSLEAVEGIVAWRTNTLASDMTPNKAGLAYINLYHQHWRSSQSLVPDQTTEASFRGFRGDYSIRIKKDGEVLARIEFPLDGDVTFDCVSQLNSLNCDRK